MPAVGTGGYVGLEGPSQTGLTSREFRQQKTTKENKGRESRNENINSAPPNYHKNAHNIISVPAIITTTITAYHKVNYNSPSFFAHLADVVQAWSGDGLIHHFLADDAHEGLLNLVQEPSLNESQWHHSKNLHYNVHTYSNNPMKEQQMFTQTN